MAEVFHWVADAFRLCRRQEPLKQSSCELEVTQEDGEENMLADSDKVETQEAFCEGLREKEGDLCEEKERCFSLSLSKHEENRQLRATIEKLEATQKKILEENKHLRRQNVSMRKERKEAVAGQEKTRLEKSESERIRKQLEKRLSSKEDRTKKIFAQLKTEIEKLKKENNKLVKSISAKQAEAASSENAQEALTATSREKEKLIEKQVAQIAAIKEDKKILDSQVFGLQQECGALTEVVVKNGREIETLYKNNLEFQRDNVKLCERTKFQESVYKRHCLQIEDLERRLEMFSYHRAGEMQPQQHHYFNPSTHC